MSDLEIVELRRLTAIINDKYSYDFSNYALSSFKRRIERLYEIYKIRSIQELIDLVDKVGFKECFLSELTVNVTEMFRDPLMWEVLRDKVIPELLETNGEINIWHAGCSSGEEVASLLILLDKMNLSNKVNVIASDIDTNVLSRAKAGRFSDKSMEVNTSNYLDLYKEDNDLMSFFDKEADDYVFSKTLLEKVIFKEHNLVEDEVIGEFDLILCRNVLIYFNQKLQNDVLTLFDKSLVKGGCLAIGSKESLMWCDIISKFKEVDAEEKIYQKIRH